MQADEEMLLLEAVDMVGLGNWEAVAVHVATKSNEECARHYACVYLASPSFPEPQPLPEMSRIDAMQASCMLAFFCLHTHAPLSRPKAFEPSGDTRHGQVMHELHM